jgi:alkanesulfonate monooxygenase SsuD/methylene tetrahydromethanopterin reductase-like flavin-dependent oxidoreductase (luciferase family)
VYTAKSVATADWLSDGRVDFGVGIGWLREEFEVLDMPFADRAVRTAEYLAVMRACWRDAVSTYEGTHYSLPPCRMYPKPIQQPNPPIYFGGETDAALRRVAAVGDGWHGFNHLPDSAGASVRRLEGFLHDVGRRLDDVDVTVGSYLQPVEPSHLAAYRDAGVDQLVLSAFAGDPAGIRELVGRLGDEYVSVARRL